MSTVLERLKAVKAGVPSPSPSPVSSSTTGPVRMSVDSTADVADTSVPNTLSRLKALKNNVPTPQSHGASGSWEPSLAERATDFGKSLLPSWRTAARISGGIVGGLAGPEGILPGVIAGEGVYQLGQHAISSPEAPKTGGEAASYMSGAAVEGALQAGIPWLANYHASHPIIPALRRSLFRSSETLITRGLNPSDNFFQNHVENGLSELKTQEARIAKSDNPVQTSRDVIKQRQRGYSAQIDKIVEPQATMKVPGSGDALAKAQIEQIPEDTRLHEPEKYANLVKKANATAGRDLTIGELNTLRSELAGTQSLYYGRDLSGQITMDSGTRAIDIARGNAARRLFYSSLDNYGLGGGTAAAQINSRIGSIIHMDDALLPRVNASVMQKTPIGTRILRNTGKALSPSKWGETFRGVDQDLNLAIKRWKKTPDPIKFSIEKRVNGIAGTQHDLLPTGEVGREPLLAPPEGTANTRNAASGSTMGEDIFRVQQRADQAARMAPPPTLHGQAQGLQFMPGPLGATRFGPKGEYLTPELEYLQDLHQRKLWAAGASAPPSAGQLEMFPGGPPNMFPPSETYPVSKPVSPEAYKLQQEGKIGTRGARMLVDTEQPSKPVPPPVSKPKASTSSTILSLEDQGRIGTRGAEKIKTAEEYLKAKGKKP